MTSTSNNEFSSADFAGTVPSQTAITLQAGASINGRLLAQATVDIGSTVVEPAE